MILLRSEIPSSMCAKLRIVVASNNRDYASQSLLLLLALATYIMMLFFTHIPFVVNHTTIVTPPERLQQYLIFFCIIHIRNGKLSIYCAFITDYTCPCKESYMWNWEHFTIQTK